ncbi:hypothetical protein SAMN05216419_100613 [Nitrosomonas cryotolerans]|uniref:Uncharacterized protein n=1 Tax=Nitrosomonas cryotolerans ATCC 49181 TaxID=1131553 RepID=A0A1N6J1I7_9PROT|nr:hypothetical protein SAMN05216419_100613 [Nitrosomonas cryotolerans]SIO38127.1 hypothetical protein SAMN02743940_2242 [Nitrosomonas cryotolerans ATCC 49181]
MNQAWMHIIPMKYSIATIPQSFLEILPKKDENTHRVEKRSQFLR